MRARGDARPPTLTRCTFAVPVAAPASRAAMQRLFAWLCAEVVRRLARAVVHAARGRAVCVSGVRGRLQEELQSTTETVSRTFAR